MQFQLPVSRDTVGIQQKSLSPGLFEILHLKSLLLIIQSCLASTNHRLVRLLYNSFSQLIRESWDLYPNVPYMVQMTELRKHCPCLSKLLNSSFIWKREKLALLQSRTENQYSNPESLFNSFHRQQQGKSQPSEVDFSLRIIVDRRYILV